MVIMLSVMLVGRPQAVGFQLVLTTVQPGNTGPLQTCMTDPAGLLSYRTIVQTL
jgi:hypothetical protein